MRQRTSEDKIVADIQMMAANKKTGSANIALDISPRIDFFPQPGFKMMTRADFWSSGLKNRLILEVTLTYLTGFYFHLIVFRTAATLKKNFRN